MGHSQNLKDLYAAQLRLDVPNRREWCDKAGVCMYAVSVLFIAPPREHAPYSSDWAEDCLEPSDKAKLLMTRQPEALCPPICKT